VHEPQVPSAGLAGAESEPGAAGPRDPAQVERRPVVELAGSVADEGFVRRVRTLLRTAPVHRLAAITGWREWKDAPYDPRVLSQAIIDAVVARTGFANQLTYDDAIAILAGLAQLAAPDRGAEEHRDVASYVLDGLLNNRDQHPSQAFVFTYSDYRRGHTTRELPFFLLVEDTKSDGRTVLEADVGAINAFRGGLDLDVEDAQMAMELVLQAQLERGDLDQAEITAQHNQRLSYEMTAKIQALLEQTRSDLSRIDWETDVLAELQRARRHVRERMQVEEQILRHLAKGEEVRGDELKDTAARVVELLGSCLRQHRTLHERLIPAYDVFLEEQQRQELGRRSRGIGLFAPRTGLLEPVLAGPAAAAAAVGEVFVEQVAGPKVPHLPRLTELFAGLLSRPPAAGADVGDDEVPPDPSEVEEEPELYAPQVLAAAGAILGRCTQSPTRLSELLAAASPHGPEAEEVVCLSVLWAFAPEADDEDPVDAGELLDPTVVAVADGARLSGGRWAGDDLLVGPAVQLLADEDDQTGDWEAAG
jgi:hypothetical protein